MVAKKPKEIQESPRETIEERSFLKGNVYPVPNSRFISNGDVCHDAVTVLMQINTKPIDMQDFSIRKMGDFAPMINLRDYLALERLKRHWSNLGTVIDAVSDLYRNRRRRSGRLVIQHCLEACEITSRYTSDSAHLMAAILHDVREDLGLSFEDVKRISGKDGLRVAQMVTALTKRYDLKDRKERDREYLNRLSKRIEEDPWIGVIKCADRLSNLTDLYALPSEKRRAIAIQTLDFYVPMALKIGVPGLADALRELSLPHVERLPDLRMTDDLPKFLYPTTTITPIWPIRARFSLNRKGGMEWMKS
jgi:hypothetical protein